MVKDIYLPLLREVEKPGRYTGGEFGCVYKDKSKVDLRVCFCFPDTYEIGMSNLGVKILRHCLNEKPNIYCERAFSPWDDFEKLLIRHSLPLYALESGDSLADFDMLAFTLQYELSYTNVLNMLKLSGIPLYSKDRGEEHPLIIGGGPCPFNPEPVADFFDLFAIGEGEEVIIELSEEYIKAKKEGKSKSEYLRVASHIPGVYVPSLYKVSYLENGKVDSVTPLYADVPKVVEKRVIQDLDSSPFPAKTEVPFIETVHDRVTLEVFRGCTRGCRFCQAGMIYRPRREKSPETLSSQAQSAVRETGYDEISLSSLSISDYSGLSELIDLLKGWTDEKNISLSLPSMRIDAFYGELMDKVMSVRKSGLTFAPEAGTQRLRDVINKNITEEEILASCRMAFEKGRQHVKLYFMIGLPTETEEDVRGIASLARNVVAEFAKSGFKGRLQGVTVSVASFVPKPHTPFQWFGQDTVETITKKQALLRDEIKSGKISYNYHGAAASFIEAVFARGDRRLSKPLAAAVESGRRLDGWSEFFSYENWLDIFARTGVDPNFYAGRERTYDETLPWDHISSGVSKKFLIAESEKAKSGVATPECREKCAGCGANMFGGVRSCCP
ncbi:MAG: TIGR03960 family B12-binding radical SAM protein [Eubacteriales bacterium]